MKLQYLIAIALMSGLLALTSSRTMAQNPSGTKIATVNPGEVFEKLEERKDAQRAMDDKVNKLKDEDGLRRKEIEELKNKRNVLNPNSPQYKELTETLLKKAIEYDAWVKISQANAQQQQKELMVKLYKKISDAVGIEATKQGYELVLTKQSEKIEDLADLQDVNQIRAILAGRLVIFDAGKNELTQSVILEMNKQYLGKR